MTLDEYYEKVKEKISQIKKDYPCILPKGQKIQCVKEMIRDIDQGYRVYVCTRIIHKYQTILEIAFPCNKAIPVPKRSFTPPILDDPTMYEYYLSAIVKMEEYEKLMKEEIEENNPTKALALINDADSFVTLALGLPEFLDYFPKMLWHDGGWFRSMEDRRKALVETLMKLENHD